MIDELVQLYGEGAIVTARPHMLDSGESYRWELRIDGVEVPGARVDVRQDVERRDWNVMVLVYGDEQVELGRWSTTRDRYGPPAVVPRLRELRAG